MKGAGFMVGAAILWGAAVGTGQQVLAQQNGAFPHGEQGDSALTLTQRVDALDQEIRILDRLRELAADSVTAAAKDRVTAMAGAKDGFSLKSADGRYSLRFRGYFQSDGRLFPGTDATSGIDNLLIRRTPHHRGDCREVLRVPAHA
jgi:hypothetical protein